MKTFLILAFFFQLSAWEIGPFERGSDEPVLSPRSESMFYCPVLEENVQWEKKHTFNPSAIVKDGKVYLIYRAEDGSGRGVGNHTSRIGIAESVDGIRFERHLSPILYPTLDDQKMDESPGGCEDPRVVETEEGRYVMTYTQWNRKIAALAIATSDDLFTWQKHGYAFSGEKIWSKSGSIVCKREGDRLVATRIDGKYWMYWGDGSIYLATSEDLISWSPLKDEQGNLLQVLSPRKGRFDSDLVEPGPAALLTDEGIILLYNGRNAIGVGDPALMGRVYSSGQVLFDPKNPYKVTSRLDYPFIKPEKTFEKRGQYRAGAIFTQGMVHFKDHWFLYYGASDTKIGVALARE